MYVYIDDDDGNRVDKSVHKSKVLSHSAIGVRRS